MNCVWVLLSLSVGAWSVVGHSTSFTCNDSSCKALDQGAQEVIMQQLITQVSTLSAQYQDILRQLAESKTEREEAEHERVTLRERIKFLENNITNQEHPIPGAQVAFMGARTTSFESGNNHLTVTYDVTQINVGGGFDGPSGIFTAPKDGVYYFSFSTLQNLSDGKYSHLFLFHNQVRICSAFARAGHDSQLSNSAVIFVRTGDFVKVSTRTNEHFYSDSYKYTTFVGMLLY